MTKALYRKYRSTSLGEILGQSHVTTVLERALNQGKVAHAYLLTGPRGVGKTSIARILAHEINKVPYSGDENLDIIEIDAASNNGVDDVRDLREKVQIAPVSLTKKVYIIDEVHMLSKPAFNALLKTLEEPPEHIVFILATTNIEKIPDTILSRTQRFALRAISTEDLVAHLTHIAKEEGITIEPDAIKLIADHGDGSFRDSISLLDQLSSLADAKQGITSALVKETLGLASREQLDTIIAAIAKHDATTAVQHTTSYLQSGVQAVVLIDQLIATLQATITEPHHAELLDQLLFARESSRPEVKLLTTLVLAANPKHKATTAALKVATPSLSAPVGKPSVTTLPVASKVPAQPPKTPPVVLEPIAVPTAAIPIDVTKFTWDTLLDYARREYVALYSVLSKCAHELDGTTLRLYTIRKFNKTKLDDPKYRVMLAHCLEHIGVGALDIETIPSPAPPQDKTAAAVAAIMGGGEEVDVSEA